MKKLLLALFLAAAFVARTSLAQVPTQEQIQAADAQLNQVYQQLRGSLNDAQKQQLKLAQRDWIKKRDAFVSQNPGNPQEALYQATMQRVIQLRGFMGQAVQQQQQLSAPNISNQASLSSTTRQQIDLNNQVIRNLEKQIQDSLIKLDDLLSSKITNLTDLERGRFIAEQQNWSKENSIYTQSAYDNNFEKYKNNLRNKIKSINDRMGIISQNFLQKDINTNNLFKKDKKELNKEKIETCIQNYYQSNPKGIAINAIYLKLHNNIITCNNDFGEANVKVWDRGNGRCIRNIHISNAMGYKWMFPSEKKGNIVLISQGTRSSGPRWIEISIQDGRITSDTEAGPQRQHWNCFKNGIMHNNLWCIGLNNNNKQPLRDKKIDSNQDLSQYIAQIQICDPHKNSEVDFEIRLSDLKELIKQNSITINDINGICSFTDNQCILIAKNYTCGVLIDIEKSENQQDSDFRVKNLNIVSDDDLSAFISQNNIKENSFSQIVENNDIYSVNSLYSDDRNTSIKSVNDNGEVKISTSDDPLKFTLVGSMRVQLESPLQISFSNKKLLVSTGKHLLGMDLLNIRNKFSLEKEGFIFDNPILSSNGDILGANLKSTNNSFSINPEPGGACAFFTHWNTPYDCCKLFNSSLIINSKEDNGIIISSNNISILNFNNPDKAHEFQKPDFSYVIKKPDGSAMTKPDGTLVKSTNNSFFSLLDNFLFCAETCTKRSEQNSSISDQNFVKISNILDGGNLPSKIDEIITSDNYYHITDLDYNTNHDLLMLENGKWSSSLKIKKNGENLAINIDNDKYLGGPWSAARWINNDLFYLSSDSSISLLDKNGKFVFSWFANNTGLNTITPSFPGLRNVSFDSKEKFFSFISSDGIIHFLQLNDDNSITDLLKCYITDQGIPILITSEGYYATFFPSQSPISFSKGLRTFPLEQFDLRLNRPDIILDKLNFPPSAVSYAKLLVQKRLKKYGVSDEMLSDDYHVPEVSIIEQPPKISIPESLLIKIKATDDKYPLDRLRVYVNSVPVNGRDGELLRDQKTQSLQQTIPIKLAAGRNKIQVSVLNSAGAESLYANAEVNCTAVKPKPKLYAVALGVSQYDKPEWCLKYAAKDATDLINKIKEKAGSAYSEVKPLLLTDKDVTKESAVKIKEFLSGATIDDTVLIFMAGHGILDDKYDYYFGTTDIDPAKPSERGMPYEAIDTILAEVPSLKKALLMDTCHAGELDDDEKKELAASDGSTTPAAIPAAATNSSPLAGKVAMRSIGTRGMSVKAVQGAKGKSDWYEKLQDMFVDLRRGSGATVISSSQGAEYAFESSEQSNGLFTYALMEALDGKATPNKDGQITISTVGDYVKKRVQDLTKGKQNPNLRGVNLEEDFTLTSTK